MEIQKKVGYSLIALSLLLFILLVSLKSQFDEQSAILCDTFHEKKLDMNTCPVHQKSGFWENISWVITGGFVIDFLILVAGIYLAFFHKKHASKESMSYMEIDISKLSEEEKKIYIMLKESNGSSYQTDLVKETGFSKVKTTRILDKLEMKGIIDRKRRGMTNIIVLK